MQASKDDAPSYRSGYEGARCDVARPISARMIERHLLRLLGALVEGVPIVVAELGHAEGLVTRASRFANATDVSRSSAR